MFIIKAISYVLSDISDIRASIYEDLGDSLLRVLPGKETCPSLTSPLLLKIAPEFCNPEAI
jgi:hypothetical protein